jgi:hypothetical protein
MDRRYNMWWWCRRERDREDRNADVNKRKTLWAALSPCFDRESSGDQCVSLAYQTLNRISTSTWKGHISGSLYYIGNN